MFWQMTLIFIALKQAKCREHQIWNFTACQSEGNVIKAVGSNFSKTFMYVCAPSEKSLCEINYIFTPENTVQVEGLVYPGKITLAGAKEFNIEKTFDGIILKYSWMNSNNQFIEFNVTLGSPEYSTTVILKARYRNGCPESTQIASIQFKGCENNTIFRVAPQNPNRPIAKYLDNGNIICHHDHASGRAIYSNGSEAIETQCLDDATWRDADSISCLYPINATLQIAEDSYNETVTLHHNPKANASQNIALNCIAIGETEASGAKKFLLNDKLLDSPNITLHPNLNGDNVSCYFENNYTKYFNNSTATYLSTSTLIITFEPIPHNIDSFCSFPNGSILFHSNPPADESSLILLRGNEEIPSQIAECCGMQYGVVGQMITPLNNSTANENLTLRADYSGYFTFYNVTPCESVQITTGTASSPCSGSGSGSGKTDLSVIILACTGGVLILIVIGLILICRRRKSKGKATSGGDKAENVNPLYGTSADVALEPKSDGQVVNPLYGTTDGETEVYSVVDKKNKKGKAKKPQKATKGNEDLYASVDKGKGKSKGKENSGYESNDKADATYSVVDKKKKGAQRAKDSTTADVDTYAVVDRTNKKRKVTVIVD